MTPHFPFRNYPVRFVLQYLRSDLDSPVSINFDLTLSQLPKKQDLSLRDRKSFRLPNKDNSPFDLFWRITLLKGGVVYGHNKKSNNLPSTVYTNFLDNHWKIHHLSIIIITPITTTTHPSHHVYSLLPIFGTNDPLTHKTNLLYVNQICLMSLFHLSCKLNRRPLNCHIYEIDRFIEVHNLPFLHLDFYINILFTNGLDSIFDLRHISIVLWLIENIYLMINFFPRSPLPPDYVLCFIRWNY